MGVTARYTQCARKRDWVHDDRIYSEPEILKCSKLRTFLIYKGYAGASSRVIDHVGSEIETVSLETKKIFKNGLADYT